MPLTPLSSTRRRWGRQRAGAEESASDDESDGSASGEADAPSGSASQPAAPSQSRLRGTRRPLSPNRTSRPETPDHYYRPSLSARLIAAVRRVCGEGDRYFLSRYQVASGLRLQMLLYFNVYVAVMYAILHPFIFQWKAKTWPPRIIVAVCQPMFFYVSLVMEPIRLIVGHVGNLGERVAWLAPFWILTLFSQLLTQVYFLMPTLITG